ncbi:MAG: hydroxymethylbilane synthase [Spirochaetaceae bacterium]|nr:hydroxymethylbilane synthase [Spirochaetaceae bacterium]
MNRPRRRRSSGGRPGSELAGTCGAAEAAPPRQRAELVLASRGSDLALAQTRLVGEALAAAHPGVGWRILTITTRGDRSVGAGRGAPPRSGPDTMPGGPRKMPATAGEERLPRAAGGPARTTGTAGSAPSAAGRVAGSSPAARRSAGSGPALSSVGLSSVGLSPAGEQAVAGTGLAALARVSPGVFTSEVAAAVMRGDAAAAVHSLKDLPLDDRGGLYLAAIPPRAAPGDALVAADRWVDASAPLGLRGGAAVGTSSPRRAALLRTFAPQARVVEARGNVPTRLRRCRDGELGAVVLARAGLERLDAPLAGLRLLALPPEHWQPAPGQGALAVQARRGDAAADLLAALDHASTRTAVELERAVLRALGGGCAAPCGAWARRNGGGDWELHYGIAAADGRGWRSYRLRGTAAGCRRALEAWAAGGPPPGDEVPAEAAQAGIGAVLFGTT